MNRDILKECKRVVIKIGTNSIMKSPTKVDYHKIDRLAFVCSSLQQQGKEVVLVSSGAVGVGASTLKMDKYPSAVAEQQALASVGQSALMNLYSRFFQHYEQYVGQILMTRDIINYPNSYANCNTSINSLLDKNIIPIINENDAVSVDESGHCTKFGENDTLAAVVAELVDADLLIIMSDVDGLYDSNPHTNPDAALISYVGEIDTDILSMAGGAGSIFSTGGMETKLKAAQKMMSINKSMMIISAENPNIIFDILNGEDVGTFFKKNEAELQIQGDE
ncbi:glutamate 5-kinase [Salinicoccus sediminis]|uniref:Glutamate 5-kinase n=1 Tax=Salinicoccus sediminis TaxID=1432562 RepID=A0A0M2SDU0_9STAP|nr:glutamate 5-kinase [Salinicoccus sediminis]KKK32884.1 glutamate 5-kinase [Salinicoccus sediminis]